MLLPCSITWTPLPYTCNIRMARSHSSSEQKESTASQTSQGLPDRAHHHSEVCAVSAIRGPVQHDIHKLIESSHNTRYMSSCIEANCMLPSPVSLQPPIPASPPNPKAPSNPLPRHSLAHATDQMSHAIPLSLFSMKLRSSGCCGLGMSRRMHTVV